MYPMSYMLILKNCQDFCHNFHSERYKKLDWALDVEGRNNFLDWFLVVETVVHPSQNFKLYSLRM